MPRVLPESVTYVFPPVICFLYAAGRARMRVRLLLILQAELIRDQRNKLRICRLALARVDGIAEKCVQRVEVAAIPGDLNGMPDRTLDPRGCRRKFRRDSGVKLPRDALKQRGIVIGAEDCVERLQDKLPFPS